MRFNRENTKGVSDNLYVFLPLGQYSAPLEMNGMTWNNKRGWSIPRRIIDSVPMVIVACVASLEGVEYRSASYLIHSTGKYAH